MARILIAEDEEILGANLKKILLDKEHSVFLVNNGEKALQEFKNGDYDLVITDLRMPGLSGMEFLEEIMKNAPLTKVIIITAFGSIENAVEALKKGAYDYITKPFSLEEFEMRVEKALSFQKLSLERDYLVELTSSLRPLEIIGQNEKIKKVLELVKKIAHTESTVLIRGETGTGKELIAQAIHNLSRRRDNPFVVVNCSALSPTLLESELFGHERGAFTGAIKRRKGKFEIAHTGSLFLDEIGDINLDIQTKLLRVIETKRFTRVGGEVELQVDVRIITATNKNLEELLQKGSFRDDLYWRLNVVVIELPPLRERKDDIPLLVEFFLKKYKTELRLPQASISEEALDKLTQYPWPGNIRELENTLQRALILSKNGRVEKEHLFIPAVGLSEELPTGSLAEIIEKVERKLIKKALQENLGVQTRAAKALGVNRATFQYKLKKYGIRYEG